MRHCVGLLADSPPPSEPVTISTRVARTPSDVSLTHMVSSPDCVGLLADSPPPSEPVTLSTRVAMTPSDVSLTNMVSSPEPSLVRSVYPNPGGNGGDSADLVPRRARIRLGLTLVFPEGEKLDQRYSAHLSWTVSQFKERMGRLLGTLYPIRLSIGPDWEELDHLGLISDTTLPDSPLRCPFLTHNSVVRVSQCPSWGFIFMASFHGLISWLHFMASFHGFNLWLHFMASFHGLISWRHFMTSFHGFIS